MINIASVVEISEGLNFIALSAAFKRAQDKLCLQLKNDISTIRNFNWLGRGSCCNLPEFWTKGLK